MICHDMDCHTVWQQDWSRQHEHCFVRRAVMSDDGKEGIKASRGVLEGKNGDLSYL